MKYQLAHANIARFRVAQDDPANADFVNSLDRVNAVAESQPGYVWRFTGDRPLRRQRFGLSFSARTARPAPPSPSRRRLPHQPEQC